MHESRALLLYGIERRYPVQVVIGRAGSGKSRLLGALSRTLPRGGDLLLVPELPSSLEDILAVLTHAFDVSVPPGLSGLESLALLADRLADRRRSGRVVALLLDDAHLLPDPALANVRLLAGTDAAGGALLPIVLAGRPELIARIGAPGLDPLRTAISTHVELLRPLPAEVPENSFREPVGTEPSVDDGSDGPSVRARAALLLATGLCGLALWVAFAPPIPFGPSDQTRPVEYAPSGTHDTLSIEEEPRPRPLPSVTTLPPPPATSEVPEGPRPLPPTLTTETVRELVGDLATALDGHDLTRLQVLLARDAKQNGMRGRRAILEAYAYRFAHVDAPMVLGPPDRIVLRSTTALVDVSFSTTYRDAAGDPGRMDGTLHLRIARHDDRLVIDSLDFAFDGATP